MVSWLTRSSTSSGWSRTDLAATSPGELRSPSPSDTRRASVGSATSSNTFGRLARTSLARSAATAWSQSRLPPRLTSLATVEVGRPSRRPNGTYGSPRARRTSIAWPIDTQPHTRHPPSSSLAQGVSLTTLVATTG